MTTWHAWTERPALMCTAAMFGCMLVNAAANAQPSAAVEPSKMATTGLASWDALIPPASGRASEDWTGASRRAINSPAWAGWLSSTRRQVDAWTSSPHERPDLVAGFMHDYVDPVTGQPLTWGPDTEEPPVGTTEAQQRLHRAWVFNMRDYNLRRLIDAVFLFRVTGEQRYRDWAASQLDFYAANYQRWPLRTFNGRGRMFQHGLDEATASFGLADAVRLMTGHVDAARSEQWNQQLLVPMANNLMTVTSPLTNIGFWHAAAVARIGARLRDNKLISWGLDGPLGTRATMAASINADGLWREGSLSYNAWMVDALAALITAFDLEAQDEPLVAERRALRQLVLTPLQLRFDNGMLPTPGDATPLPALDRNRLASIYRLLPTWWGLNKAASQPTWNTLLQPPPAAGPEPEMPPAATRHLEASRMAVLRAGQWQAFVHYGQSVHYHAQEEALTYELHHGQSVVSSDPGTVAYGSPLHGQYFSRAASHNVPMVDGLGQQRWLPGQVKVFDAAQALLKVTHPDYQPGAQVTRSFRAASAGFVTQTQLQTSDGKTHRLGEALHTSCTVAPGTGLQRQDNNKETPPRNATTAFWREVVAYQASGQWSVLLDCAGARFNYQVSGPATQLVFMAIAPTTPVPASRRVVYYETVATQAEYTAGFSAAR